MSLERPFETGELYQRNADPDAATHAGQDGLGSKINYAPDNRKIPPEPGRPIGDVSAVAVPSSADLFAEAVSAVQNTVVGPDGSVMHGILVGVIPADWWGPASSYIVYAADENDFDADCFVRIGIVWPERDKPLEWFLPTPQLIRGRTYTIAVVPVNADGAGIDPTAAPQAAGVSLGDTGQVPPDVADFDALVECCDLVFTWTPVTDTRNDVAYYEIRQGAAFAGGAFVGRAWGWNNGLLIVPIGLVPNALVAPNDEFHIKAITGLGAESTLEGSDTLTTIQIACLQAFCCGKARELTPTPGSDTILITSLAPTPGGIPPIINIGGGGGNPGPNGVISGGIDPTSFVANGSRWDYTILLDDTAVVGDRVMVLESVRLV